MLLWRFSILLSFLALHFSSNLNNNIGKIEANLRRQQMTLVHEHTIKIPNKIRYFYTDSNTFNNVFVTFLSSH